MNPFAAFLLVAIVVVAVVVLAWLAIWWVGRRVGVNRAELRRMRTERDLAVAALERIDQIADTYRDLYGPDGQLAVQVRQVVRDSRMERTTLT